MEWKRTYSSREAACEQAPRAALTHPWAATRPCRELLDGWQLEELFTKFVLGCKEASISSRSPLMRTDADIMISLEQMFTVRSRTTKRKVVTTFMNLRMKSRQAITHLNIAELNSAEINGETKIDMIVNSLSDSFDQFKLDYTLNNKEYTSQALIQDVQNAEMILVRGKGQEIYLVRKFATVETRKKVKEQ
ncbi:hypothetical protein ACOSQ2_014382 [Xanthoceras sorbifolium]